MKHSDIEIEIINEQKLWKIRNELSEDPSGWRVKQIMNIIYERTGVRYHEVHIYRLLHKWDFSPKVPKKRFVNIASKKEKEQFKKKTREIISNIHDGFTILAEDESIFVHDMLVRRMWAAKGIRPTVTITG